MRQFSQDDSEAATAKLGLYSQDEEGNWRVDPKKEALRMANHTRCYHTKPTYQEVFDAVTLQFHSGEGAIQYVPEAVARANADLLDTPAARKRFLFAYTNAGRDAAKAQLKKEAQGRYELDERELEHRMDRYGLNPCGEIVGRDFHCNLAEVHLNTIDPSDYDGLDKAFYAAGLQVAALLQHKFVHERYQYSREIDPIVGVSFTGLFDFYMHAFGYGWLEWMMAGRPAGGRADKMYNAAEQDYLRRFREAAHRGVKDYCSKHGIRTPNRITTVQPAGTKSLLTGASSGWHPPKAQRFIRRITLGVNDPLVPALIEYGYNVIPAQSARDDEGNLLDDISDPRVHEVLVEIPTEVSWANIPGVDQFDLAKLPVLAQWGIYMNVQNFYTDHNTSATIELRDDEIEDLAKAIYEDIQNDGGYISAALLARFDVSGGTFPRLPFEPISKEQYDLAILPRQVVAETDDRDLLAILEKYDSSEWSIESVAGCTNASCIAKAEAEEREGKV
jgi:ribonucleotide reductase class II